MRAADVSWEWKAKPRQHSMGAANLAHRPQTTSMLSLIRRSIWSKSILGLTTIPNEILVLVISILALVI